MTLTELLALPPKELHKLTTAELQLVLAPYYNLTRTPLLPADKPTKKGLDNRLIAAWMDANREKLGLPPKK